MTTLLSSAAQALIVEALAEYPTDRSCYTCDYYHAGKCANAGHAEIPVEFCEKGCEAHKDEGSPF